MEVKRFTGFIFARGGSKGIPKKNLREIGGMPLIGHAVTCGLRSQYINKIIVSTDCNEIAAVARDFGAETPFMRPVELAADNSPELLSWQHAIQSMPDYFKGKLGAPFISLPTTSPLREPQDIDKAINKFLLTGVDLLVAVSESRRNPYLNMVAIKDDGCIDVIMKNYGVTRRQDVPRVYDISTVVYVAWPTYILDCKNIMEGNVGCIEIPPERAIDIDDIYDLHLASLLFENPFKINKVST